MGKTPIKLNSKVFKSQLLIYCTNIMLTSMDEVKGTALYSTKVIKALDEYSSTKQRRIFKEGIAADQAVAGTVMIEKIAYSIATISEQPFEVSSDRKSVV